MKNKIILAASLMTVALTSVATTMPRLNSSTIDVVLSTGTGIQKDYTLTAAATFTTDASNPTAVTVINNIPNNQSVSAGNSSTLSPALVFYTNATNPLTGTLNFNFSAAFADGSVFTNSYQLTVDGSGNITNFDDLPAAQNGVVCEFITTAGVPTVNNPQINIQCQDYNS